MSPAQIKTVLGSRIADIEHYLEMFDGFEDTGMKDWSQGMVFTVGLARSVMTAMKRYIEEHGEELIDASKPEGRVATA